MEFDDSSGNGGENMIPEKQHKLNFSTWLTPVFKWLLLIVALRCHSLAASRPVSQSEQNIYSVPKVIGELGATGIDSRGIGSTLSSIRIY